MRVEETVCVSEAKFLGDVSGFASDIFPSHLSFIALCVSFFPQLLKGPLHSSPTAQPDPKAPDYLPPSCTSLFPS